MAKACGVTRLRIFGDSKLVVQQVMNHCNALSDNMMAYRNLYYYLEGTFDGCEVSHVSRSSNEEANTLANIGSQCLPIPVGVFWEEIIEILIQNMKPLGPKKVKQQPAIDPGVETAEKQSNDEQDPEDVMIDQGHLDAAIPGVHDK
jgi:hypothetical protein